ncbi:MAG: DUF2127 domain-containing protein [Yoonia sp.]|nr:DUF2127 domain-containing protein [Yoonia sp.]
MSAQNAPQAASKWAHLSFLVSMIGKGLLGLGQIIGGLALAFTPSGTLNGLVLRLAQFELVEDPNDFMAKWAQSAAATPHIANETFYTIYLLIHGGLNLSLVLALLAEFRWAYSVSLLALVGFIAYQFNKFAHTGDIMMIVLSVIDIFVIWLIWREWKAHQRATK